MGEYTKEFVDKQFEALGVWKTRAQRAEKKCASLTKEVRALRAGATVARTPAASVRLAHERVRDLESQLAHEKALAAKVANYSQDYIANLERRLAETSALLEGERDRAGYWESQVKNQNCT